MPFFSVVIPLYNKQDFIAATLKSILAQTFTNFEVIVVNDVCTDNSLAVVNTFTDSRIRIINHPLNKGLSASRNTGIKEAKAGYITFIDADDMWQPQFLEAINRLILSYPEAGLFACKYAEVYGNGINVIHPLNIDNGLVHSFFESGLQQPLYCQSGFCVKKEVFDVTGYYNEAVTFAEDIDFNIRANYHFKLAYTNEPLTLYLIHQQNQMTVQGITGRTLPDLDSYEPLAANRPDIKRYLDFYRYVYASWYKQEDNREGFLRMMQHLDPASLNAKQRLLLRAPAFVLRYIKKVKSILIKRGINPTSY